MLLLNNVKGLEQTLTREYGGDERIKEIEYFEMKMSDEASSILNSFNIHRSIDEIKSTVIGKIENIKRLVSLKKKEEVERTRNTQADIKKLKTRINEIEKGARKLTKKAEQFQAATELNDKVLIIHGKSP